MKHNNVFANIPHGDDNCLKFFLSHRKMAHAFGCYYMGYLLEDASTQKRICFTTNMSWGSEYLNKYIHECHLWNEVQSFYNNSRASSLILPWEMVSTSTPLQEEAILRREDIGIGRNGVSFCKKMGSKREYYYFAPEKNNNSFMKHLCKNIDLISGEILTFRDASTKQLMYDAEQNT